MTKKDDEKIEEGSSIIREMQKKLDERSTKITLDKPDVQIFEMKMDAISRLADKTNEQFSELKHGEEFGISQALIFSSCPVPALSRRLKEINMDFDFSIPLLKEYVLEIFIQRHKMDRKRVDEYLKAIENMSPKNEIKQQEQPRLSQRWF